MRLLLVSDHAPYSTFDVYKGYCEACDSLGIPYETVNMPELLSSYSTEVAYALVLSKLLLKDNGFTHVLYIAGTMVPDWVLATKYDKKVCMVATDDPHSTKMLLASKEHIDYFFTNEKALEDVSKRMYYIPTAATSMHLKASESPVEVGYYSDVLFIGSVYPNRVKGLENAIKWCQANDKKITILGPIRGRTSYGELFVPEDSIIHTVGKHCIMSNEETTKWHRSAKVVLNMDRDTTWSPAFINGNPHKVDCVPYSANPRVYEVAACKTTQLYIDPRKEAMNIFGDNMFYCDSECVGESLSQIFDFDDSALRKKAKKCYEIVKRGHTYTHRMAKIIEYLIKY